MDLNNLKITNHPPSPEDLALEVQLRIPSAKIVSEYIYITYLQLEAKLRTNSVQLYHYDLMHKKIALHLPSFNNKINH